MTARGILWAKTARGIIHSLILLHSHPANNYVSTECFTRVMAQLVVPPTLKMLQSVPSHRIDTHTIHGTGTFFFLFSEKRIDFSAEEMHGFPCAYRRWRTHCVIFSPCRLSADFSNLTKYRVATQTYVYVFHVSKTCVNNYFTWNLPLMRRSNFNWELSFSFQLI